MSLAEVAERAIKEGVVLESEAEYVAPKTYPLSDTEARKKIPREEYRNYPTYAYATQVAIVEVEEATGQVEVLRVIAAHDVGVAVNPQQIRGQLIGSIAMGQGYAMGMPQTQAGYAAMTPFSEDQYGGLLAGDVDTTQFGDVADVYRREAMGQLEEEMLPGIRSKMVGFQPGGGTRGDLLQAKALSSANQRVSDNIAKAMFGAQQQAEALRLPAAQMGLGAQQFGMGYGLQGMEGARAGMGMYPSLMGAPLGMYGAAQGIGAQQQALDQAAIDRDIARYEYQSQLPQQALGQYLSSVQGDYGGLSQATGPGGTGGAETLIAALAAKAIGL